MDRSSPQLRSLGEALGMEVLGIDLSGPLEDATFAWIAHSFAEHPAAVSASRESTRCSSTDIRSTRKYRG